MLFVTESVEKLWSAANIFLRSSFYIMAKAHSYDKVETKRGNDAAQRTDENEDFLLEYHASSRRGCENSSFVKCIHIHININIYSTSSMYVLYESLRVHTE
jgi:hypothetical protein